MTDIETDVLIVGGGLGGVAAALAALRRGRRVVLTEQYAWLGGQLTSQIVPPDEAYWVEQFGITASYRALRDGIRDYYREHYPLTESARAARHLNPGLGRVSRLCHEPRVAVAVIEAMLAPYRAGGRLTVLQPAIPVAASVDGDTVTSVAVDHDGVRREITASFVLDATETGDLLPLTGTEYVVGAESRADTGEPSAAEIADPRNVQAITWCFAFDHDEGADHTVERPAEYERFRRMEPDFWGAPLLSFTAPDPRTLEPVVRTMHVNPPLVERGASDQRTDAGDRDLWEFRRILARENFRPGFLDSDVVVANWPMLDYLDGSIIDVPDAGAHLAGAKDLARSYVYWLQTEAPRPDGGTGFPGLRLRPDIAGTDDGFAQAPYIRESRRIVARRTIVEQDISVRLRGHGGPATFDDTVGVGMYRIDIHPSTGGDNYIDVECAPFEIPLGALIPVRMRNLLPAAKNIGTTHITNGAYRLHPVEWNIGESAGELAAFCVERSIEPALVADDDELVGEFQARLVESGIEIHWPEIIGY
ncbi:putative FAD-binding dehydrogenase [Microbacterium hydrocarbonoxydans]|uniref:Putative FAD-binding dehydrogenase n=1 Tax=Microbacterium hydrocarbonoxydans TaxID=273678 RepID=A0A0M2HPD8_9MICO|nr:FAD-dependent oxidoreductase [Microbacterium hydrocarbonoxydans]KJL48617.1 putative FAD-binding dehydrogenase [Microbacterium hydrocarbonoxydans]